MQSILIIGLGRFGRHLCRSFMRLRSEVLVVDSDEAAVAALADEATDAQIADCTDEAALRALGVHNFDLCCVCIGSDFASSLLITSMLKEMGAKRVIAKASQDIHAKLLLRNGADEVVYPERDSAERWAMRLSAENVLDYIELTDGYALYEIPTPRGWEGKTIRELDVRNRHRMNILAVKTDGELHPMPGADYRFTGEEHVLSLASREDASRLLKEIGH